jgi:putative glutamine amidotransferase
MPALPRLDAPVTAPLIAVTGVVRDWAGQARTGVNAAYVRSVVAAGGIPVIVSPLVGQTRAAELLHGMDGLLLSGGEDVDPALYREPAGPALGPIDRGRDLMEIALFAHARDAGLPVLAICRGLQVVNVALGGSLWQDLPSERPGTVEHAAGSARTERSHAVRVEPGSRLAEGLGAERLAVNSFHHQGIKVLAEGLAAAAWAEDGLIEGIEGASDDHWLLGVQWHPEEMHAERGAPDARLFAALVREALSARERDTARSPR